MTKFGWLVASTVAIVVSGTFNVVAITVGDTWPWVIGVVGFALVAVVVMLRYYRAPW